jgi:DNA-binding MarR family transcriptional regulator
MPASRLRKESQGSVRPADNAFRELIRTFGVAERVMQPYFARFGISGAQWGVLRNLIRAEEDGLPDLRLTELSERLLVRPPSMVGVVDRLERAGLVFRAGSPTDLRAKRIGLTGRGRRLVRRILAVHEEQMDTVLSGLTRAEQDELRRLLILWRRHLESLLKEEALKIG